MNKIEIKKVVGGNSIEYILVDFEKEPAISSTESIMLEKLNEIVEWINKQDNE